jgi:antitoxin component YwqK of YwqJK toxin-antitoxin module
MSLKLSNLLAIVIVVAAPARFISDAFSADRARPLKSASPSTAEASDSLDQERLDGLVDPAPVMSAGGVEVIRERYADGKIKIERQVVLDDSGNYVNHGEWKLLAPNGDVIAQGNFDMGHRTGPWMRWQTPRDAAILSEFPFNHFKPPFQSTANFVNDKMDGEWLITDSAQRKCAQVALSAGKRNGVSTIWLPSGSIYSQATYENGTPTGDVLEADKNGQPKRVATYSDGRKLVTNTVKGRTPKQKKSEEQFLEPKTIQHSPDDFWTLKFAEYTAEGEAMRHGPSKLWFDNGQLQQEGAYQFGKKNGTFTYYYDNGQVAATGEYHEDKAEDVWVWWHRNGQKATVGRYIDGQLIGEWRWWNEDGKLANQVTYNEPSSAKPVPASNIETSMAPQPVAPR